ncbi:uncharacterized protein FTJAE_5827 [Fusarium tjaetaba]|uniref:Uncharacterized protein n=1 Tax=Fusarium tjaetaba TaxID=1567544 RepID=A0A8H5VXD4_9HYPO|nr:uncharacterized protein FTJAE_5827 [Fusarium tjaetaba]KAF5636994.1 hypothetical protein FTJAE_5827 [Fusarium tjaetaba]
MSPRAIKFLFGYLETGSWIDDATIPSRHPAYKSLMGPRKRVHRHYYPWFFVIQAIYPSTTGVRRLCESFSAFWGLRINPTTAFYPCLQDSKREYALIKGVKPRKVAPHATSVPAQHFGGAPTESSAVPAQQSSNQQTAATTAAAQPDTPSSSNPLNNYEEQLTSIRGDFERRLSEFQNQLHKDAIRS